MPSDVPDDDQEGLLIWTIGLQAHHVGPCPSGLSEARRALRGLDVKTAVGG